LVLISFPLARGRGYRLSARRRCDNPKATPTGDFTAWNGSPLADIAILQDRRRLRGVYIAGREIRIEDRPYDPRRVTDFSLSNWTDLYTQARVAELRGRRLEAAE
jgi:hypothetical protein